MQLGVFRRCQSSHKAYGAEDQFLLYGGLEKEIEEKSCRFEDSLLHPTEQP